MPTVSVIIPTYNRLTYLGRAIESVLKQTFQDYELIVVDDCSTDGTPEYVASVGDRRIKYLRHDKNLGAPAARNTGIKISTGTYIAFLDSDNEWLSTRLEKQVAMFAVARPEVGVIYANNKVVDDSSGSETVWAFGLRGKLYNEFLQRPFMDFITPLIRRECFDKVGLMDERVPSYQEWETFIRISRHFEFDFVPETLAIYHIHSENRISAGKLKEALGYQYIFDKHRDAMLERMSTRVLIEHHRNLAHYYRRGGAFVRALKNILQFYYYRLLPPQA